MENHTSHPGASRRLEALTDGIFAIVATILVLEIHVPEVNTNEPGALLHSVKEIAPSLIAFIFSFLNILIFWVNHDSIGKVLLHFDTKLTYLNILFLLFISLIPFTTAFVSRYPLELVAITSYSGVLLFTSIVAALMYRHIAFKSKLMHPGISRGSRRVIWKRIILGPLFFALALALGWFSVFIPIVIYLLVPLLFLVLPKIEFEE
jgi:uncharacterized membrane protein